ncbi:unnamed protein product [Spirodela intermedia]|uniref:O-fucosyltransferase family protein n=1 Tax=Spirodela intermedia TaxID=51605 RepID=A0A7I8IBM6_SPIIN|nr:unnamed protein product [Spirodela intermedia]CAA6654970.1 unnamed protein product [Spirodela intermedia]
MNAVYNRLLSNGGSGSTSPSPPASPMRSPRLRHGRPPKGGGSRIAWALLSLLLRRQAIFLFAPLIYISGMLLYMGTVSLDVVPRIIMRPPPGSLAAIWRHPLKGGEWRPCINRSSNGLGYSNGYIYVEANGGLNQQRISICNAVAVAGYLNATLVIPNFHFHSVWKDPRKVPDFIMERFGHNMSNVPNFKIKAWSPIHLYRDVVLPKLMEERLIRISPFANRLSEDAPGDVQRLRCLANYEALRFSNPISSMAESLVARMRRHSLNDNGRYIAVHLRFEEDMVAFSCCVFDGGEKEKKDMDAARERGWRGKFTKRGRVIRPGAIRMNGKCPLTPLEVGLMLRGMGFNNNTSIYLASGKIYEAERTMAPLLEMFPLLQTKEMLASAEELAPFKNYSSRMAAIDYTVCLQSEVFVTTQGGNFPHFLIGHRRYLNGGHSKTIKPDKRKLALLFDNQNIGWRSLRRHLVNMRGHSDAKGIEIKRPSDSIYTYPCPDCMCRLSKSETSKVWSAQRTTPEGNLRSA